MSTKFKNIFINYIINFYFYKLNTDILGSVCKLYFKVLVFESFYCYISRIILQKYILVLIKIRI